MTAPGETGLRLTARGGPDVAANRRARKWSGRELAGRALWEVLRGPLFAWTPRPMWGWRRQVLRAFGARIGPNVHLHPTVRIAVPWNLTIAADAGIGDDVILYCLGPISIGEAATVSQNAHLCAGTHDFRRRDLPLVKAPVSVRAGAWVCADAFVGPGVTVGEGAVIGARAVVTRDVPAWAIMVGNPARRISKRSFIDNDGDRP